MIKDEDELRLLLKVSQMYYEDEIKQDKIAKELGIYRTTISRLLKKAREEGIVKIQINKKLLKTYETEQKLINTFGLKEAIVVPVDIKESKQAKLRAIGKAAAQFMNRIIKDNDVIGLSWGSSLAATINELTATKEIKGIFVPIVGGPAGKLKSEYHVNTLVYKAAQIFNCDSKLIDYPVIFENKETAKIIRQSNYYKRFSELWNQVTVAFVGIGSPALATGSIWSDFYGTAFNEELEHLNVAGDICSNFYNLRGEIVPTSISEQVLSIKLELLKNTRYTVGIAESPEKVSGILGALNGCYINSLVTTEETANLILQSI